MALLDAPLVNLAPTEACKPHVSISGAIQVPKQHCKCNAALAEVFCFPWLSQMCNHRKYIQYNLEVSFQYFNILELQEWKYSAFSRLIIVDCRI